MTKRSVLAVFVAAGCALFGVHSASAQTMEFGEEAAEETMEGDTGGDSGSANGTKEVPKGDISDKAQQFLDEGKSLYDEERYDQASLIFHKVIRQEGISSKPAIPEARYRLAKTLMEMKLYQGALSQFGEIVKAGQGHPYFVPTLSGLLALAEVIPAEPTLRKHLAKYAELFPSQVPENQRDRYAYLTGRHFYSNLNVEQAARVFNAVSQESPYYAKSQYIMGTTYVANYDAQPAIEAFKRTLRYLKPKEEEGRLNDEETKLLELTNLAMARVFYSTGDYETSLKYYDEIGRGSPRWPQALFEESWAYFQLDRFNKALGNLHSLNSPFFRNSYFPEGPILAAVIYFYNCKYDRVGNQLDEFEYLYEPLRDDMQSVLDANSTGAEMFDWYQKLQKGDVEFGAQARRVIDAALEDKQVKAKFDLVEQIENELEKVKSMPGSWKTSKLGQSIIEDANLARSFAQDDAGSLARQRLKRRADKLNALVNQKKKIEFEVARAKKENVQTEKLAQEQIEANQRQAGGLDISDKQMYWEFNGEYWRDELGHYVFNIGSECKR